jgi:hypothetical protein
MSINKNQSLAGRLIRIVEANAATLTEGAVRKLQASPHTLSYQQMSQRELYERVYEVYHDLGRWLWEKSNAAIERWYGDLGEMRCKEAVPLSQVIWALVLTKDYLIDYLDATSFADSAVELYQQQEFDRIIGHFFDRAICYAVQGYESSSASRGKRETARVAC